mmetsp:Transcript_3945/g.9167  ORF Transcript_3945/g.9167 Transcript_3945/m.9167 type:complete len:90 (+) Transcript_3945:94-363(+)
MVRGWCALLWPTVLVLAQLAQRVAAQEEESDLGSYPACWINWKTVMITESGNEVEQDACIVMDAILILNVVAFYTLFAFMVKVLVLSTQ